ncbi:MAG: tRNA (guanosine(37)-N1)-methyltransferase TrmD [Clostridiaceae bacterium]|nr:tRNA (guanosine(37)-N1)-methyltransferase TrmD [Oscillospiraceae bacterium]NLO63231.1 tRNA (guanosine(37)-N1)-methyltransferase TrmD [Clostridiaceae bacterium]
MIFSVLTLFPKQVSDFLSTSIIGRAINNEFLDIRCIDIRDYADNSHGKVDDTLYGGGKGMLIACEPVYRAWKSAVDATTDKPYTVHLSPKGTVLNQKKVIEFSNCEHLILLCGHYEGVDQRVIDSIADEEISIGDYVLTGGEAPACVLIDAVSRMLPGVLPDTSVYEDESHMNGALEAPHFTKPEEWGGMKVPEVLRNGHHAEITKWRRMEGLFVTYQNRRDLFDGLDLTPEEWAYIIRRESEISAKSIN